MSGAATPVAETPRDHLGGIIGVGLGLVLIAALSFGLSSRQARTIDGRERLATWFGVEELPLGFEVEGAVLLAGGTEVVRLGRAGAEPERQRATPAQLKLVGDVRRLLERLLGRIAWSRGDWSTLEEGPKDQPPREVFVMRYPLRAAKGELERLFSEGRREGERGGMGGIGPEGGHLFIRQDLLRWGGYDVRYAIRREFEPGRTFVDSLRANLSRADLACSLVARWSRSEPASAERIEELLEAFDPGGRGGE